jgi:uncharacterized protein HemX
VAPAGDTSEDETSADETSTDDTSAAMPVTMPETGGAMAGSGLSLLLMGLALAGGGYALRRRKK